MDNPDIMKQKGIYVLAYTVLFKWLPTSHPLVRIIVLSVNLLFTIGLPQLICNPSMILHYHMAIMKLYAHPKCLVASDYVQAHSATWHREWSNRSITRMNAFTVSLCVGSCFLRGKYHNTVDLPSCPQNNAYFITTVWVVIDTDENNSTTWTCMYSCKGYLALATKIIWFYFDKFVVSRSIVHAFAYLVRLVHIHFDTVILGYFFVVPADDQPWSQWCSYSLDIMHVILRVKQLPTCHYIIWNQIYVRDWESHHY